MLHLGMSQQGIVSKRPFYPTDIDNLLVWLDSSDLTTLYRDEERTTLATSDGDTIGGWNDKSGNGNSFEQATLVSRPLYKEDFNTNYTGLLFDGTDDALYSIPAMSETAQDYTMFFVASSVGDTNYLFDNGPTRLVMGFNADEFGFYDGVWTTASLSSFSPSIITYRLNSATSISGKVHINNTLHVQGDYTQRGIGSTTVLGSRYSGTTNKWNGYIAEFVMYSGNLTEANISVVERYLSAKYGISL